MEGDPRWNLWVDQAPRPGYANMAIDTVLLERANQVGECWLRLYRWEPHCLSFGRHEPALRRYDVSRIRSLGLDTVRRPTGGRAVWHARELTYAVAAPSARFGSLHAAYLEIHRMIAEALGRLGMRVSLAPPVRPAPIDAGACFARPAGGELMVGGRKVVGSAQYRHGLALLQHGSILLEDDQAIVGGLSSKASGSTPAGPRPGGPGRPLDGEAVAGSVAAAAESRWAGLWQQVSAPVQVLERAWHHHAHYRSEA
ncbi:MAG TPA: hypothetical protein VFU40_04225, partial [Gemmatimonadales bacterium]|nr:hypothetical protein [Gemmatimonadales bacterium]